MSWLYLINATENTTELPNQHENILLFLATPSPCPLKDKDSLMPTDGFHHQSMEIDMTNSFIAINKECILMLRLYVLFVQSMFDPPLDEALEQYFWQTFG